MYENKKNEFMKRPWRFFGTTFCTLLTRIGTEVGVMIKELKFHRI